MDCDTTALNPTSRWLKYKLLAGGGMLKIVNPTVPRHCVGCATTRSSRGHHRARGQVRHIEDVERRSDHRQRIAAEHLPVFDCAFKPARGMRSIHYLAHLR